MQNSEPLKDEGLEETVEELSRQMEKVLSEEQEVKAGSDQEDPQDVNEPKKEGLDTTMDSGTSPGPESEIDSDSINEATLSQSDGVAEDVADDIKDSVGLSAEVEEEEVSKKTDEDIAEGGKEPSESKPDVKNIQEDEAGVDSLSDVDLSQDEELLLTDDPLDDINFMEEESDSSQKKKDSADEIGIDLGDDELWEDETEEISLFEEELLEELKKEEEEEEKPKKSEETPQAKSNLLDEDSIAKDGEKPLEGDKDEPLDSSDQESKEQQASKGSSLLPWIVTGFSSILCGAAIFVLINLWQNPLLPSNLTSSKDQTPKAVEANKELLTGQDTINSVNRSGYQSIDLAPFIIPGRSGGELVFFKLKVELTVPDATSKQALLRRQAWVRDIIYQQLKGLDISNGVKGDVLSRFRQPILTQLNKELAPIRVLDVKLMGYILR